MFLKIGAFKNFATFTGIHMCWSLFLHKVAGLRPETLLKKRLQHRCFPVKFGKFLTTAIFTDHLPWLLLQKERINQHGSVITVKISYLNDYFVAE